MNGYVNIDIDSNALCDLKLNYKQIREHFQTASVKEILMIHSISYLNLWEARDFFSDAKNLLEDGGVLILEFPSIEKCALRLIESRGSFEEYIEGVRGIYAFDLSQMEKKQRYVPYAFGWSGWHIRQELENVGFSKIKILEPQTHNHPWRDIRVEAKK